MQNLFASERVFVENYAVIGTIDISMNTYLVFTAYIVWAFSRKTNIRDSKEPNRRNLLLSTEDLGCPKCFSFLDLAIGSK